MKVMKDKNKLKLKEKLKKKLKEKKMKVLKKKLELKKKLKDEVMKVNLTEKKKLELKERNLTDNQRLSTNAQTSMVRRQPSRRIQIFVRAMLWQSQDLFPRVPFALSVNEDDTIDDVKAVIEMQMGVAREKQRLVTTVEDLLDVNLVIGGKTLSMCGIKAGDTLALYLWDSCDSYLHTHRPYPRTGYIGLPMSWSFRPREG